MSFLSKITGKTGSTIDDDTKKENIKNLIELIKTLTVKIQILQLVSDKEKDSTIVQQFSSEVSKDITKLTAQMKELNTGKVQPTEIEYFNDGMIDGLSVDESVKTEIRQIQQTKVGIKDEEPTNQAEGGARRRTRRGTKPQRGGFFQDTAADSQPIAIDSMDNIKINAYGTLGAANPMTSSMVGTDVLLKAPDSFSAGSFANNLSIPREIAQVITPVMGGQAGGARKTRKSKKSAK